MDRSSSRLSDESSRPRELLLNLTLRRGRLRFELQDALRRAIHDGTLPTGTVLRSSRQLALDLGVSRGVVVDSYDQLASEGYLDLKPREAPAVASVGASIPAPADEKAPPIWRFDFKPTSPDPSLFPRKAWVRALESGLRKVGDAAFDYGDHRGRPELRKALSTYLARTRGVRIDPGHLVITQGFTQALDILGNVLTSRGMASAAMESPSHPGLWATVRESGMSLVGCAVDDDGLQIGDLAALNCDVVVVSPAHQYPTGSVMSPIRRAELVGWARRQGGVIIEDDYDAEFRYDRIPIGAVQGLDPSHVVHVGSASKTLAPGLRLGWVSAPPELALDLHERKYNSDSGSPVLGQLALAEMLLSGEYDRQVVRVRHIYRRRRDLLVSALTARLPWARVRGVAAGMQALLPLPDHVDDVAIANAASAKSIRVEALSPLHLIPSPEKGLLLGFGRLPEIQIAAAVAALASVIEDSSAAR